jgi:peptidoglycan/xylan/chitin deacetylase (PgdA/CDA1 family)
MLPIWEWNDVHLTTKNKFDVSNNNTNIHRNNTNTHTHTLHIPHAANERNLNVESMYDYGARCGFWRLHRLFTSRKVPVTVWGVGMALERNMEVVGAIKQQEDWEVSSHGYRWWDYKDVPEDVEKEHIDRAVDIHKKLFGKHPAGLYQGKPSTNTRRLAVEEGGFLYDSDAYNDDLPYWTFKHGEEGQPHLIIPYTLVENDMLYTAPNGWSTPDDFLNHLKRTLE